METPITRIQAESHSKTHPSFIMKDFDEIPTFEEAFDPVSLRKFFQEHESTNSQSVYSPRKEASILGDTQSQGAEENESIFSPIPQTLSKSQSSSESQKFSFNFNLSSRIYNKNGSVPGGSMQKVFANPFLLDRSTNQPVKCSVISKSPKNVQNIVSKEKPKEETQTYSKIVRQGSETSSPSNNQNRQAQVQENSKVKYDLSKNPDSRLERMIKCKKVFKIQREVQQKLKPLNSKRKFSAPPFEELESLFKKVKSESSARKKSEIIYTQNKGNETSNRITLPAFATSPKNVDEICNSYFCMANASDKDTNIFHNLSNL